MKLLIPVFSLAAILLPAQRPPQTLEPVTGITADGVVAPGLFSIRATGVSTKPVKDAADRFLAALSADQRAKASFAAADDEWRRWNNVHRAAREGVSFTEMNAVPDSGRRVPAPRSALA